LIINFRNEQTELDFFDFSSNFKNHSNLKPSNMKNLPGFKNLKGLEEKDKRYDNRKDLNKTIPIEDIGIIIIDHYGVILSHYLLDSLLKNNCAVIFCNMQHLPSGMLLNLDGNKIQSEKFKDQINISVPLKKNLWQQTVQAKIRNQAELLKRKGNKVNVMFKWANDVRSGDPANLEATAAQHYWKNIFPTRFDFVRTRFGPNPNNLLNYGYAILRAITARSLSGSGLLPTLGIFHKNKYNAYCLADDIMEPYRPFVDAIVCNITNDGEEQDDLTPIVKKKLLEIAAIDVFIKGEKSPLMVGMQRTTASLAKCYEGSLKKISYPEFVPIN
jgi:CRISP-associated protein Cas1